MDTSQSNPGFYPAVKNLAVGSWESTEGSRVRFFAFVLLFVIAYTLDLMAPWAMGYTLGVVVKQGVTDEAFQQAMLGIGAYVGLLLAKTLCHHIARYLQQTVAFNARMKTLEDIFSTLLRFPLSWHVSHHSGESLSRLHRSAGAIDSTVGTYIWQIIEGFVKFAFASIAILALDFWVAANVLTMGFITVLLMVLFNKKLTSYIRQNNAFYDRLNRICIDYLFNIVTVKS
ncbi:MAG: ABC transporter ATP-binding protein, partial [Proteobacteria bacterium]|nr:ABC transporter ATP-binding protein [Pseudomonadota bacterium]